MRDLASSDLRKPERPIRRSAVSPEDRKLFGRWAVAVAALYLALSVCVVVAMIYNSTGSAPVSASNQTQ